MSNNVSREQGEELEPSSVPAGSLLSYSRNRMFAYHSVSCLINITPGSQDYQLQACPEDQAYSMICTRSSLADLPGGDGGGPVSLWSTGLPSRVHRNLQAESPPARRQPSSLIRVSQITKQWLVKKILKKQSF